MSEDSQAVNVRILDKDYKVACPKGEHESLIASAKYVDGQMRDIKKAGKVLSLDRLAVMVALNIAHELLNNRQQIKNIDSDIVAQLETLQDKIQSTLDNCKNDPPQTD